MPRIDVTGKRYGKLSVVSYSHTGKWSSAYWKCQCDCGNIAIVRACSLRDGLTRSCGCLFKEHCASMGKRGRKQWTTHGLTGTVWHRAAIGAFNRCHRQYDGDFDRYKGRGIEYKFNSVASMAEWLRDNLGDKPPGCSLDRINNDAHYEPGNLRWANSKEQALNRQPNLTRASNEQLVSEIKRRGGYAVFSNE